MPDENNSNKEKLPSFKIERKQCQYCFKKDHFTQHCKMLRNDKKIFLDKQIEIRGIVEQTIRQNGIVPGAIVEIESRMTALSDEITKDYVTVKGYDLRSRGLIEYNRAELEILKDRDDKFIEGETNYNLDLVSELSDDWIEFQYLGSENRIEGKPFQDAQILFHMEPMKSYLKNYPQHLKHIEKVKDFNVLSAKNMGRNSERDEIIIYDDVSLSAWSCGGVNDIKNLWECFKKDMGTNNKELTDGLISYYSFSKEDPIKPKDIDFKKPFSIEMWTIKDEARAIITQ